MLPEDEMGPRVENRCVAPLTSRGSAALVVDPRQYQGENSLVLVRGSVWLRDASWYIPFWIISSADPSDVRKRLGSMYLLDDPFAWPPSNAELITLNWV